MLQHCIAITVGRDVSDRDKSLFFFFFFLNSHRIVFSIISFYELLKQNEAAKRNFFFLPF